METRKGSDCHNFAKHINHCWLCHAPVMSIFQAKINKNVKCIKIKIKYILKAHSNFIRNNSKGYKLWSQFCAIIRPFK
jgi:hypothetical protein